MRDVAADLPRESGAYALLIRLEDRLRLDIPRFQAESLAPGLYAYCGSANGPGGIRARVSRHLRTRKPLRWHVDWLTANGRILQAGVLISGHECELVAEILSRGGLVALPGFGSSDCRKCAAHLVRLSGSNALPADIFDLVLRFECEPQ
jgi:Uri superfamily endonuclease